MLERFNDWSLSELSAVEDCHHRGLLFLADPRGGDRDRLQRVQNSFML